MINAISHEITLNLISFSLKITKNVEDCHSPISSFAQMLSSEIMSTFNSRKFCSQPFSICLISCFFFQFSVPYYFILIFSSTLVNSLSSHWMELLWTCSSSTKSCWSSYFKKSSKGLPSITYLRLELLSEARIVLLQNTQIFILYTNM